MPALRTLAAEALRAQPNRVFGFDLLRAIAILITVYGHAAMLLPPALQSWHNLPASVIDGVNIFFVLSGYLIGGILLRALLTGAQPFSLWQFWMRRWLRTLPAYLLVLGTVVAVAAWQHQVPAGVGKYFVFSQNLTSVHPAFFPEGWSLAVEEWFYLLFPLVVLLGAALLRNRRWAFAAAIGLLLVLPPLFKLHEYRLGLGLSSDTWDAFYRRIVAARLDAIALGVLGCYLQHYHHALWQRLRRPGLAVAVVLLGITFFYPKLGSGVLFYNIWCRPLLECLAVLLVLPCLSQLRVVRATAFTRSVTLISLISYSMYLLNKSVLIKLLLLPLLQAVLTPVLGSAGWLVAYIMYWILLLGGALLLYSYVEVPFMHLREAFEKPRQPAPPASPYAVVRR